MDREQQRLPFGKPDGEKVATAWNAIASVSDHASKYKMGFASALPILRVLDLCFDFEQRRYQVTPGTNAGD